MREFRSIVILVVILIAVGSTLLFTTQTAMLQAAGAILLLSGLGFGGYHAVARMNHAAARIQVDRAIRGRKLSGRILTALRVPPEQVQVTVRCVHEYWQTHRQGQVIETHALVSRTAGSLT